jgi:membrane protease YdiL (CAAX protease family)
MAHAPGDQGVRDSLVARTRRPRVATWMLFTLAHLSGGGAGQVIIAAFGGLVLTALYFWRGNLWANIIAHWLTDGAGLSCFR